MTVSFICPSCHNSLTGENDEYICGRCNARYLNILGVPLLVKNLEMTRSDRVDTKAICELANILKADTGADCRDQLYELFSLRFDYKDAALQIESSQFLNRMHASGCPVSRAESATKLAKTKNVAPPINANIIISMSLLVAPSSIPPSTAFGLQVIINNQGDSILSSTTEHPVYLSYFWEKETDRIEGLRTPLLIDLQPGARLMMPVLVRSPNADGNYRLRLMLVHENVRWVEEASISIQMAVLFESNSPFDVPWKTETTQRDYYHDHRAGIDLLQTWVDELIPTPNPKILELGGNACPLISELVGMKFNADIDIFGLIFGILKGQTSVSPVVADGMNLPFPEQYFDMIVTFSTFHHFSEPITLLKHLKTKLAPRGLICLLCEPIGHVYKDSASVEFIEELSRGVNEQSFELWEYAEMFRQAALEVADVRVDVGSLKIALKAKRPP